MTKELYTYFHILSLVLFTRVSARASEVLFDRLLDVGLCLQKDFVALVHEKVAHLSSYRFS